MVEGYIANIGISLDVLEFLRFEWFFPFFKKIGFLGILGPPYCGIGATIRNSQEILCLPYAGFLKYQKYIKITGKCRIIHLFLYIPYTPLAGQPDYK